ncbi:MAG: hypothetical protein PHQ12_07510 [Chthoniobacteraceae bacterium]|nr:hypothetical protein [Chthoniobacteraceae bacterium]
MSIPHADYPAATRIGLDFVDPFGIRHTTCQLIRPDGYSVASANFVAGQLAGFDSVHDVELPLFFALCSKLISGGGL